MKTISQQPDPIAALKKEIEGLSQQVKRLIRAEAQLYEFQETLDAQLNEYAGLYELNKTLSQVFDLQEIFECAVSYAINNLGYQRVLLFQQDDTTDSYTAPCRWRILRSTEEKPRHGRLSFPAKPPC